MILVTRMATLWGLRWRCSLCNLLVDGRLVAKKALGMRGSSLEVMKQVLDEAVEAAVPELDRQRVEVTMIWL